MNLETTYLGLKLEHPFMPGASPLVWELDDIKKLEDGGASAIVMHSLFEEQIKGETLASIYHMELYADAYQEALSYFPKRDNFKLAPEQYIEHIRKVRAAVSIPVIASLNGTTRTGWLQYAAMLQQAGANAIELNVYHIATSADETGDSVEKRVLDIVSSVAGEVSIPVAVKLSPFFSSLSNLVFKLEEAGAGGFVLFNRFYQPDVDLENLEVLPQLHLSDSSELLLRLRWLAILTAQRRGTFAVSGGVRTGLDAVKSVLCGASAVQVVSELLRHGPQRLGEMRKEMAKWMEEKEYTSLRQMCGVMNQSRCPDPAAFERGNYMRILQSYRPGIFDNV